MNAQRACELILNAYRSYYDVNLESPTAPFSAEAAFRSHDEQYFLVKSATISESESNEYVFFAVCDQLDTELLRSLDQAAWDAGMARVRPHKNHRNTDVTLVIVADAIPQELIPVIKRLHHYRSYRFGLMGWTNYRIIALDCSFGRLAFNRQGRALKKLFLRIIKQIEREKKGD